MKKISYILLFLAICLVSSNQVFALDVKQKSLVVVDKSSTINVIDEGIKELSITPKLEFNEVGDFISYKLIITNNDKDNYKIESVTDDSENEYIKINYTYDEEMNSSDKSLVFTLKYDKLLTDPEIKYKNAKIKVTLIDEDNKKEEIIINDDSKNDALVPETIDNINYYFGLLVISLIVIAISIKVLTKNNNSGLKNAIMLLMMFVLIPTFVYASPSKEIVVSVNFDNIKIIVKHSVTFNSDGGTDVDSQTVKNGEKITKPANPEKEHYNFVKWLKGTEEYDFNNPVTSDFELKAEWEKKEYTVTYNSNDGSEVSSETVKYEDTFTKPSDPTKDKHEFVKWLDKDGNEYDFSTPASKDITLEAEWIELFTVTFNSDGGTDIDTQTVKNGEKIAKPANPEKEHYNFVKWLKGTEEYDFNNPVTSDFELKAEWEKKEYTVTYNSNDGSEVSSETVKYGDTFTKPSDPTKDKHEFVKWLDKDGNEYDFSTPASKDITLEAEWIELYTITYNSNGGTDVTSETVRKGETFTKPTDPTKEHYVFVKWLNESEEYDFSTPANSDIELFAHWTPKEYTITYILHDGEDMLETNPLTYNIETPTFMIYPVNKYGYTFDGWTGSNGDEKQIIVTVQTGTTGDLTYEAHYTINEYTVTFDSNGGTDIEEQKVKYLETATRPSDPEKDHYVFNKWLDENGNEFNFNTQITKDTTLSALWDKEKYTVTYDSKGGSAVDSETVEYQEKFTKPENPTKTGYRFIEWLVDNNAAYDFNTEATKNITLTASWQAIEYTIDYELNNGEVEGTNPTKYNVESNSITLINPTKDGSTLFGGIEKYEFAGWTGSNGTTPQLEVIIPTGTIGNKNYTANYKHFWKVFFFLGGAGSMDPNDAERFVEENTMVGALPTITVDEGYEFKGWIVTDHNVTEEPTDESHVIIGPANFVAVIEPIEYTVTLDTNGGSYSGTTSKTYNIETNITMWDPATDSEPTRSGYVFKGWTGNGITEPSKAKIEIPVGTTGNKTYTANWVEEFIVTFNSDGGTPVTAQAIESGEMASIPEEPTKTDYIFKYWMDEDGNKFDFGTSITENITLTAKWQVAKSTIEPTDTGSDNTLNLKMKKLSNPGATITNGYNFNDTSTKAFKKATEEQYKAIKNSLTNDNIVSTSNSLTPVYMWFNEDSGTMYWYTEAAKVEFTGSMGRLFAKYNSLTDISGFADFDTSNVTDMNRVLQNCTSLTDIGPLENWDVSNVKSFIFAFGGGNNGQSPSIANFSPISNWNVGNCEDFNQMFKYNTLLTNLDAFKTWNMSSATNIKNMFTGTTALTDASAIKEWNVVNVTNEGFGNVFSSSGILPYYNNVTKLPPFDVRPGRWTNKGAYTPNS